MNASSRTGTRMRAGRVQYMNMLCGEERRGKDGRCSYYERKSAWPVGARRPADGECKL